MGGEEGHAMFERGLGFEKLELMRIPRGGRRERWEDGPERRRRQEWTEACQ